MSRTLIANPGRREVRAATGRSKLIRRDDGKRFFSGTAIVYDSWSVDLGGFREIIRPGAAARAVRERHDIRFLGHHDPGFVLGRTKSGTLKLAEDRAGLHVEEGAIPDNPRANELADSVDVGDIDGMSFAFDIPPQGARWIIPNDPDALWEREIFDMIIYEVSIVAFPAYTDTTIAVRELEIERRNRSGAKPVNVPIDLLNLRLRLAKSRVRS